MNPSDLKKLDLNKYYQPNNTPVTNNQYISAIKFEDTYESVQGQVVIASKLGVQNFVKVTIEGRAFGDFSVGSVLYLSTDVSFQPPNQNKGMYAINYMSLYQGTVDTAANQIYPNLGANVTPDRYHVQGALDWESWGKGFPGRWRGIIIDTQGTSTQEITYVQCWEYIDYTVGGAA